MAAIPTTQRAYSLRLEGKDQDESWRNALWKTHEVVNKGTKAFGDWLLTLRGGLSHELARKKPDRRVFLALSWLSVEDEDGAPKTPSLVAAHGTESTDARRRKLAQALVQILRDRRVNNVEIGDPNKEPEDQPGTWIGDCLPSLAAEIREDAVWINRSAAFDDARQRVGDSLTREEVWDILEPFFGGEQAYFAQAVKSDDDDEEAGGSEEKAKDLVQKAGGWLSNRFGAGKGADFDRIAKVYDAIHKWAEKTSNLSLKSLAEALHEFTPPSNDAGGILKLISGPGYKSATRNLIGGWEARPDLAKLKEAANVDRDKCAGNMGAKGRRRWSDAILADVEHACGFTYLQSDGPARHKEYSVMLDHAARRVSIAHSWIKRAEARRQQFAQDAQRVIPEPAKMWLDNYCTARSTDTGALEAGYRIRKRAISGWDKLVIKWSSKSCITKEDRVKAVRELQADPEIDKPGDFQLFAGDGENEFGLAGDDAMCVWQSNGKVDPEILKKYVAATEAQALRQRFKVPAYRHPDALSHPVFCDFGNSRWEIRFDVHEQHKRRNKGKKPDTNFHPQGLRMGLWNGAELNDEIKLRWSCKRLVNDLALKPAEGDGARKEVSRADRFGRAVVDVDTNAPVSIVGLFDQPDWNGRLQAPREELNAIAKHLWNKKVEWDDWAEKKRKKINWLISFSAKLTPNGPWHTKFVPMFDDKTPSRPFVSRNGECAVKHEGNETRKGLAKLVLCRLPGLRLLSVDLGHRYAAACAVWEILTQSKFEEEIAGRRIVAGGIDPNYLFTHTEHVDPRGKTRKTVYRRTGPDMWARLDRQFLIKLQGEERPARAASDAEKRLVEGFDKELGYTRDEANQLPRQVDELMSDAVRLIEQGLRRYGDYARIAFRLLNRDARREESPLEGVEETSAADHLSGVLMLWYALAMSARWKDDWALDMWNAEILPLIQKAQIVHPAISKKLARPTVWEEEEEEKSKRRAKREEIQIALTPVAKIMLANEELRQRLSTRWARQWEGSELLWKNRLKKLRAWILPRKLGKPRNKNGELIPETDKDRQERFARRGAARNVGGLSLTRISTIRSVWQVYKSFRYQPRPESTRAGICKLEEDARAGRKFGDRLLQAMEQMREQRVKQLASRIIEAALGIGRIKSAELRAGSKRPRLRIDAPCHAIAVEDLTNYRPEEIRTRRENRQLMSWSAAKVKKFLSEGCLLHGLHLREISPAYTSRQDSRTGQPGMRCTDISLKEFAKRHWRMRVKQAEKKNDAESRFLVDISNQLDGKTTLRLPQKSGELFISINGQTRQADLNAAANIGLRALMDSDWQGKWWYVPCQASSGKPDPERTKGSVVIPADQPLIAVGSGKAKKDVINLWRDCSNEPLKEGQFKVYDEYWNGVRSQVSGRLYGINGIEPRIANASKV